MTVKVLKFSQESMLVMVGGKMESFQCALLEAAFMTGME